MTWPGVCCEGFDVQALRLPSTTPAGRWVTTCPRLSAKDHGSWYYATDLPAAPGQRRAYRRRGGFPTRRAAEAALAELQDQVNKRSHLEPTTMTVAEYLESWLAGKAAIVANTSRCYRSHLDLYLIPGLGHLPLARLGPRGHRAAVRRDAHPQPRPGRPRHAAGAAAARRPQEQRGAPGRRGEPAPGALHAAVRAEHRREAPPHPVQPDRLRRAAHRPPAPRGGVDRRAGRRLAGHRRAAGGGGVDGRRRPPRSSTTPPATTCTRCSTWSRCAGCAAARPSGCAGPRSTSTRRCSPSTGKSSSSAGPPSSPHPRPTACAPSPWTPAPPRCCAPTGPARPAGGSPPVPPGPTPAGSSPTPTEPTCTPRPSPSASPSSPRKPDSRRSGCTTSATAPPPSPWPPGADLKTVSQMLGHSTIVITADTYTSVLPEHARAAAENTADPHRQRPRIRTFKICTHIAPTQDRKRGAGGLENGIVAGQRGPPGRT